MRLVALAVLLTFAADALGQCASCGGRAAPAVSPAMVPAQPVVVQSGPPTYVWEERPNEPGQRYVYRVGPRELVGCYYEQLGKFRYYHASTDSWSAPVDPPFTTCGCAKGCKCAQGQCDCTAAMRCCDGCGCIQPRRSADQVGAKKPNLPEWKTHGVAWSPENAGCQSYSINGQPVSRSTALNAVATGELPDDSRRLRLTIIDSNKTERQQILADLKTNPTLTQLAPYFLIQAYDASDWAVARSGFSAAPLNMAIYIQHPDGKVLSHQRSYGGPEALAQAMTEAVGKCRPAEQCEAKRDPDPDYRPDLDPDLSQPDLIAGDAATYTAAVGVALLLPLCGVAYRRFRP